MLRLWSLPPTTLQQLNGWRKVLVGGSQTFKICCTQYSSQRSETKSEPLEWSSQGIRQSFLQFFQDRQHTFVPSSSVIPKKGDGTYFVNAGMNQFKPIFLEAVDLTSSFGQLTRAVNSQKCIRIGGKHNDLDDVGKDTYHHTFFEMLGNWSFGDYFKKEACLMAWELLTDVYKLSPQHLYVTYFAGDSSLGLGPDEECLEIWRNLGVAYDHIIASGSKDNFWDMGDTGPCGPCTEIHYDLKQRNNVGYLVNSGDPDVMEIWNLVFMQYDRQPDSSLLQLPRCHVDTGMGMERITTVLQGKNSNYDTDLFLPLLSYLQSVSPLRGYQGLVGSEDKDGVDTAYRIVADHSRMFSVAIADGLKPGRGDLNSRLRHVIHRALHQAHTVLKMPPGKISLLVPIVADILGQAYPGLHQHSREIIEAVNHTEENYLVLKHHAEHMVSKALVQYGHPQHFTGDQIWDIQDGRFGRHVPVDILADVAMSRGISVDMEGFQLFKEKNMKSSGPSSVHAIDLSSQDIAILNEQGILPTVDSFKYRYEYKEGEYEFAAHESEVAALRVHGKLVPEVTEGQEVEVILDSTMFYAESGGQVGDKGVICTQQGGEINISDVQRKKGYVLHQGKVTRGTVHVADSCSSRIDKTLRERNMCNHTATHMLNYALMQVLGNVHQQGSHVSPEKLRFDFSCSKIQVTSKDLIKINNIVKQMIVDCLNVYINEIDLNFVERLPGLRYLKNEIYPPTVRLVTIGRHLLDLVNDPYGDNRSLHTSMELCGGCHVNNSSDLMAFAIINFTGSGQGKKSITAVTGKIAEKALAEGLKLRSNLEDLKSLVISGADKSKWSNLLSDIEKTLGSDGIILPKIDRAYVEEELNELMKSALNKQKNKDIKSNLKQKLEVLLMSNTDPAIVECFEFDKTRDMIDAIVAMKPLQPLMLIKDMKPKYVALCYTPPDLQDKMTSSAWANEVCESIQGVHLAPPGKYAKRAPTMRVLNFTLDGEMQLEEVKALSIDVILKGMYS